MTDKQVNKTTEALLARIEKLEAANKLAEEAFVEAEILSNSIPVDYDKVDKALAAIREALAGQEKQEPVGEVDLHKELGQLRWMGGDEGWDNAIHAVRKRLEELYAAPVSAKREWVDLTDDEIGAVMDFGYATDSELENAHAVIAAFKEKNK